MQPLYTDPRAAAFHTGSLAEGTAVAGKQTGLSKRDGKTHDCPLLPTLFSLSEHPLFVNLKKRTFQVFSIIKFVFSERSCLLVAIKIRV